MADKYGTDCGVKGMKNYLHIFIKGAFVLFLIAYLTVLYFFYKAASPMAVEEICIMKATDNTQANTLLENANAHLSGQKQVFEGYGTDQMALLNNAVVGKKGNYVYYMCGADAQNWRTAFLSMI